MKYALFGSHRWLSVAASSALLAMAACSIADGESHGVVGAALITELRPDADILGGSYTANVAGSPYHAQLSDESGSTYVYTTASSGRVTVSHPAPAPNDPVTDVVVHFRARRAPGITARVMVDLLHGTDLVASSDWITLNSTTTDHSATFSGLALPDGTDLRTRFIYERLSGTGHLRIFRSAIDVTTSGGGGGGGGGGGACGDGDGTLQYQFTCTQVIGFSQTNNWYTGGPDFEDAVDDSRWELKWNSGAGVSRWEDPSYTGWSNAPVSPCASNSNNPDRVVFTISDSLYSTDVGYWATHIRNAIDTIRAKYPNVQRIDLQPVVGGPDDGPCVISGTTVRASANHPYIDQAIAEVVATETDVFGCHSPEVRTCADYADTTGHIANSAKGPIGGSIGSYYAGQ